MTITYSFTPNNTIRIHCGGDTLEVPLPSPAPDSITSPTPMGDGTHHYVPPPTISPTVVGIFTTDDLDIENFPFLLSHAGVDTPDAIISFRDLETTPSKELEYRIKKVRGAMTYGESRCFILDVRINRNKLPTEAQLSALEEILRNPQHHLQGIRLLKIPDA